MSNPQQPFVSAPWLKDVSAVRAATAVRTSNPVTHTPFDILYLKNLLDPDPRSNAILHSAGIRYHSDWRNSGMEAIAAINYDRIGGGSSGTAPGFMPATERQMIYRQSYRAARAYMGDKYAPVVEGLVLLGRSSKDCYPETGYRAEQYAQIAVRERLWGGLTRLSEHYKIDQWYAP